MYAPILIWGVPEDPPTRAVHDCLAALDAQPVLVDFAAIARTSAKFCTAPEVAHHLTCDGTWLLEDFSAAYLRPYDARDFGGGLSANFVRHIVYDWAEHSAATIVNRPSAEATNHSKLRQALAITQSGFATPESLVTNVAGEILEFSAKHRTLVYKSLSSVRSVVKELAVSDVPEGPMGPVFVQERIKGRNIRVHVVGNRVFACSVQTDAIDYRYSPATLHDFDLDADVAERCVALTQQLGLIVSGIDLIVTSKDDWYCLEVNPNPGFTAFDRTGDKAVARAVAELLLGRGSFGGGR
jgi:glutathione synthase/RimK-type ligase-like ATP-grasp enzyme